MGAGTHVGRPTRHQVLLGDLAKVGNDELRRRSADTHLHLLRNRHQVYAQLVDDTTGLMLGNLVTPTSVILDGKSHDVSVDL